MTKLKKVAIFTPPYSQYEVLQDFTLRLTEALKRDGVTCELVFGGDSFPEAIKGLLLNPPDFTLSFNGLLPDAQGRFLCDYIKIPHVACLVDSPIHFFPLVNSPLTITACVDHSFVQFFSKAKGDHSFFFPHAIDRNIPHYQGEEKKYELLMLGSCLDIEAISADWKKNLPERALEAMHQAVDVALKDPRASCMDAFTSAFAGFDTASFDFVHMLDQFETYVRGRDRVDLINHIDPKIKIDIFGSGEWKKYVTRNNVSFHNSVDQKQVLDLMREGKVILNSCAHIKNGSHERVLNGLASGAAVITNENVYLRDQFGEDKGVRYYHYGEWERVNEQIHELLLNDEGRRQEVKGGSLFVREHHTWDNRARLLSDVPV